MYNINREENMTREQDKQSLNECSNIVEQTFKNLEKQNTIENFIKENKISIHCEFSDSNPLMSELESSRMNHYKVTLKRKYKLRGNHLDTRYGHKRMTLFFSQGVGINGEPKASSVLDCLKSDWLVTLNGFEDFCNDCGYSQDSIRAKKIFDTCVSQGKKLQKFLNDDHKANFFKMGTNQFNKLLDCESL